jgi:hypothetical protein
MLFFVATSCQRVAEHQSTSWQLMSTHTFAIFPILTSRKMPLSDQANHTGPDSRIRRAPHTGRADWGNR